jgi:hypothetical protein
VLCSCFVALKYLKGETQANVKSQRGTKDIVVSCMLLSCPRYERLLMNFAWSSCPCEHLICPASGVVLQAMASACLLMCKQHGQSCFKYFDGYLKPAHMRSKGTIAMLQSQLPAFPAGQTAFKTQ